MSCPANAQYRVTVSATRNGVTVTAPTSLATQLTDDTTPADELRAAPRIIGKAVVGETLTTDSGVWAQQSSYTYQWSHKTTINADAATVSNSTLAKPTFTATVPSGVTVTSIWEVAITDTSSGAVTREPVYIIFDNIRGVGGI